MHFRDLYISKKQIVIGSIVVGLFLAILIIVFFNSSQSSVQKPSDYVAPDAPITLYEGDAVYGFLKSDIQIDALRSDLTIYATKTLKLKQQSLSFTVKNTTVVGADTLQIDGTFSGSNTIYRVSVTKLPNDRITVSIVDPNNPDNSKASLPSNSKANQFAATLPKETANYYLEYIASTDTFLVRYYVYSPDVKKEIESILAAAEVSADKVSYIYPRTDPQFED